jgi:hypothetical protein
MPLPHLGVVLRNTSVLAIHKTGVGPGGGVSRLYLASMPLLHLGAVLRNLVLVSHKTEVVLGGLIPLFCRPSVPLRRLGVALGNTFAFVIQVAEDKLCGGVSLLSLRLNELLGCLEVATTVCINRVLDRIREHRTSRQEGEQGGNQDQGGVRSLHIPPHGRG